MAEYYFTDTPCKNGHTSKRYVSNGACVICTTNRQKVWVVNHPEYSKINTLRSREWRVRNPRRHSQLHKECNARYKVKNPEKIRKLARIHTNNRKADTLHRTPSWAELPKIREFYNDCSLGFEVDHIIPLKGKLVSGLHVIGNLQYLPKLDNIKKGNKFFV